MSILNPKEVTQDTRRPLSDVDAVLEHILESIKPIDFKSFASANKDKIIQSIVKELNENLDNPEDEVTPEDALEILNKYENQGLLTVKEYRILFIDILIDHTEEMGNPISDFNGETRVYSGTHWLIMNNDRIQDLIRRGSLKMGVPRTIAKDVDFISKCLKQLQVTAFRAQYQTEGVMLNFQNGTIIVNDETGFDFKDSDPCDLLTYVLPYDYDPEAKCTLFQSYLDRVIPQKDKQTVLAEFIASCFTAHKHEKALILFGTGANGKSVFYDTAIALLGEENVCSHSLQQLIHPSGYNRGQLGENLLNYSGEISSDLQYSDEFKKLASREKISARYPYGRPFEISNYARLAFNCNELPKAEDTSEGFYRRFLIIEFDQYITKEERDVNLAKKIIKNELPGVMNWVLEGLKRLVENEGKFSKCESADRILQWYKKHTNTVFSFIESDVFKNMGEENKASDLLALYHEFCEAADLDPVGDKTFYQRLQNCGLKRTRKSEGVYYQKDTSATSSV